MTILYKIAEYKSSIYHFIILPVIIFLCCSPAEPPQKNILARVDGRIITVEEFRLFYEFDPNFGMDSGGLPALKEQLHKYIDRYLAAERARAQSVTDDPEFARAIRWEQRSAMLRQLYREQVSNIIEISEEEIRQEFSNSNASVHVRHLFSENRDTALRWYNQLKQGESFENLAMRAFNDSVLSRSGGDLGWMLLRDLDDDFAAAAAKLTLHEISQPVKTRWGYHIIQLLDRRDKLSVNPAELSKQREMLEKRIRQKKSRELSSKYIAEYIGKLNPQPDKQTFLILLKNLVPASDLEKAEYPRTIVLTNAVLDQLLQLPDEILAKPLIAWDDGITTLGQYVADQENIPLGNRPRFTTAGQLSDQIGVWIRDELLSDEARRLDLDDHPRVKNEVRNFIEEQSYYYYLHHTVNDLEVPANVQEYFSSSDRNDHEAYSELSRFHTIEQWKYRQAEKQLQQELKKNAPEIQINMPLLQQENYRIDWERRIRMFMIRKPS